MESFTAELVSNASGQLFLDNTLSCFTYFLPEELNLECQGKVAISGISYPSLYENVTEGKFMFFDKKTFKIVSILLSRTWSLPFRYGYLFSPEHFHSRKTQSERKLYNLKVYRSTQKLEIYLSIEGSCLAFFSTDMGEISGRDVGHKFGVMVSGKGAHKPDFAYDIVRIHNFMIYTDLIE